MRFSIQRSAFNTLANAIATNLRQHGLYDGSSAQRQVIFRASLLLLYRLLFERYAEARHLQPDYPGYLFGSTTSGELQAAQQLLAEATLDDKDLYQALTSLDYVELEPGDLGSSYEHLLEYELVATADGVLTLQHSSSQRKASGSYYTPDHVVRYMLEQTLEPMLQQRAAQFAGYMQQLLAAPTYLEELEQNALACLLGVKIFDPAMGSGNFLLAAVKVVADWLLAMLNQHPLGNPLAAKLATLRAQLAEQQPVDDRHLLRYLATKHCVYGVDLDAMAVELARITLWLNAALPGLPLHTLDMRLVWGDALAGTHALVAHSEAGFDVVVSNPPYLDSEEMMRSQPALRHSYGAHWQSARGNWDLFVPFIELGLQQTRPGGYCSMIVPNKLLGAEYCRAIRAQLGQLQLKSLRDYAQTGVFAAEVYPIVFVVQQQPARGDESLALSVAAGSRDNLQSAIKQSTINLVPLHVLRTLPTDSWSPLFSPYLGVLQTVWAQSQPLTALATVHGAASVAEAYLLADLLREAASSLQPTDLRFVNTGTIDRYRTRWGNAPTRYLKRTFSRPVVAGTQLHALLPRRYQQASAPKLILAGMVQRLEAFYDTDGQWLAGKSTVVVQATPATLAFLLALLNSNLYSALYRALFGALALGGGYLRVGPPQLAKLPIRHVMFSTPSAERTALLHEAQALYAQALTRTSEASDWRGWRTHWAALWAWADAPLLHAQTDALYDLLGWLAEQLQALYAQKSTHTFATDRLVDLLVYRLYALSDQQIDALEGERESVMRESVVRDA